MQHSGGTLNGVLHAAVQSGASLCNFSCFCTLLCVSVRFSCQNGLQKSPHFARTVHMCIKCFYARPPSVIPPPLSYTPFPCHGVWFNPAEGPFVFNPSNWKCRGPKAHLKSRNTVYQQSTAFTRTFSKTWRELLPASL